MAFGLDDLADWIRDLVDQGSNAVNVVNGNAPLTNLQSVNQNVKQGIVDPGKMLSEFSGLAQGYRGAKPNASNMDKGLALLALAGALGGAGASDDIARAGGKAAKGGRNKFLDVFGKKTTMYHGSPQSGITKLIPNVAKDAGSADAFVYLSPKDRVVGNMPQYLAPGHRMPMNQKLTGSVYQARVPTHRLQEYTLGGLSRPHWAKRTSVPVKIKDEIRFSNKNVSQINDALEEWIKKHK